MTTLEVLRAARKRLPRRWIQGFEALDRDGFEVPPQSPDACQWCLVGAVAATRGSVNEKCDALAALRKVLDGDVSEPARPMLTDWNDARKRTSREVLALLDRAIAAESKGEP